MINGCGALDYYARGNAPLTTPVKPIGKISYDDLPKGAGGKGVFIGIAMSGGGSRAANFSAAVLQDLEHLGFMEYVSAISSVSGSSLPAAYYGLFHEDKERWNPVQLRERLLTNFEADWFLRWFLPQNVARYWFTHFDRSDIMKEVFDDVLFEHKTFNDMLRKPKIYINATSFTKGERFVFDDDTFRQLGSRLDTFPVSHAVMASGAFPGAFHNVTVQDYRISSTHHYEHVYDGGPSDNLGTTMLLDVARQLYKNQPRPQGCFIFVVDAFPFQELPAHALEADTRGGFDFIFDTNAATASDTLLSTRREDLLRRIDIEIENGDIDTPLGEEFDIYKNKNDQKKYGEATCSTWHISFQRLLARNFRPGGENYKRERDRYRHARLVGLVANVIPTRYRLTGVEPFTAKELQDYIYEAARLLICEDSTIRSDGASQASDARKREATDASSAMPFQKTCTWFAEKGLQVPACHDGELRARVCKTAVNFN